MYPSRNALYFILNLLICRSRPETRPGRSLLQFPRQKRRNRSRREGPGRDVLHPQIALRPLRNANVKRGRSRLEIRGRNCSGHDKIRPFGVVITCLELELEAGSAGKRRADHRLHGKLLPDGVAPDLKINRFCRGRRGGDGLFLTENQFRVKNHDSIPFLLCADHGGFGVQKRFLLTQRNAPERDALTAEHRFVIQHQVRFALNLKIKRSQNFLAAVDRRTGRSGALRKRIRRPRQKPADVRSIRRLALELRHRHVRNTDRAAPVADDKAVVPFVVRPVCLKLLSLRILDRMHAKIVLGKPGLRSLRVDSVDRTVAPLYQPDGGVVRTGSSRVDDVAVRRDFSVKTVVIVDEPDRLLRIGGVAIEEHAGDLLPEPLDEGGVFGSKIVRRTLLTAVASRKVDLVLVHFGVHLQHPASRFHLLGRALRKRNAAVQHTPRGLRNPGPDRGDVRHSGIAFNPRNVVDNRVGLVENLHDLGDALVAASARDIHKSRIFCRHSFISFLLFDGEAFEVHIFLGSAAVLVVEGVLRHEFPRADEHVENCWMIAHPGVLEQFRSFGSLDERLHSLPGQRKIRFKVRTGPKRASPLLPPCGKVVQHRLLVCDVTLCRVVDELLGVLLRKIQLPEQAGHFLLCLAFQREAFRHFEVRVLLRSSLRFRLFAVLTRFRSQDRAVLPVALVLPVVASLSRIGGGGLRIQNRIVRFSGSLRGGGGLRRLRGRLVFRRRGVTRCGRRLLCFSSHVHLSLCCCSYPKVVGIPVPPGTPVPDRDP
nr:MAG TPA: hypothetical protein [Caudoviricetes sp.]